MLNIPFPTSEVINTLSDELKIPIDTSKQNNEIAASHMPQKQHSWFILADPLNKGALKSYKINDKPIEYNYKSAENILVWWENKK